VSIADSIERPTKYGPLNTDRYHVAVKSHYFVWTTATQPHSCNDLILRTCEHISSTSLSSTSSTSF